MRITLPRAFVVGSALVLAGLVGSRASSFAQEKPAPPPAAQPPAAQQPATPPPEQPIFRAGINTVRVDVIVTDRQGNPVTDLTLKDFEIQEDGKPQTADTFRLIKIDTETTPAYTQRGIRTRNDEETAAANENSRIFAFFLDDYHVMRESSMSMRKPVMDFIANQLSPSDLVTVMYPLTPVDAAVLTRNHQGVINAVDKFQGRKYNYEPMNGVEQGYVFKLTPDQIEMIRRQVTFGAIRGLCTKLGSLREGRKSLIMLSEGFNATLPPQMRSTMPGGYGTGGNITRDPFAGDNNPLEDRAQFSAGLDMNRELQDVWDACNRNNTSIYAVDPRGLAVGGFDITSNISMGTSQSYLSSSIDTLRVLADNTDGRAIVNRNDLAAGMKQIIRDSSAYYLVGYNSTQAPRDGKFHEIKVRVKRPGVQVRARRGYWAYTEDDVKRALAGPKPGPPAEITKALQFDRADDQSPLHPHLDRQRQGSGRHDARDAVVGAAAGHARRAARWAAAGHGAGHLTGRRHCLSRPRPDRACGGRQRRHHSLPGAARQARDAADGGRGWHRHTRHRGSRAGGARPVGAGSDHQHAARLVRAQRARVHRAGLADAALPSATREFRRTDRLLVRFDAYAPGTAAATVTAQLLNQQGTKMIDVPVIAPAEAGQGYSVDLPLAPFAAGQYLLEITANSEGHKPVSELVAFRLGS